MALMQQPTDTTDPLTDPSGTTVASEAMQSVFCMTPHAWQEHGGDNWWFGGGTDITPCYIDKEDMKHFHGTYKAVCDRHDPEYYSNYKDWADRYFGQDVYRRIVGRRAQVLS
jgi:coproporphyrinogen III oxidase